MMKRTKLITVMIILAMVIALLPGTALAEGSYSVDTTYLVLTQGQTGSVYVTAQNAAGRVDWNASGAVSGSGSFFLDNGTATIEVTADSVGTGTITVLPTDIVTYDDETIDYSYTIQVEVTSDTAAAAAPAEDPVEEPAQQDVQEPDVPAEEPVQAEDPADTQTDNDTAEEPAQDTAQEDNAVQEEEESTEEETTTAAEEDADEDTDEAGGITGRPDEVLTDGNDDYADLTSEERLYSTVDGQELYIIQFPRLLDENGNVIWNYEVSGLDVLTEFEYKTVNYKEVSVDTFQYKDLLTVFVLKNLETDTSGYYVIKEGKGFTPLTYVPVNGKQYIVLDFPTDFKVPEGYQMVELLLGTNKVQALKQMNEEDAAENAAEETADDTAEDAAQNEADNGAGEDADSALQADARSIVIDFRNEVMLKGYETVISPGLQTSDPTGDIYYLYCLVDGVTQLYSYDSGEKTLQRAALVVYNEIPTEPQTIIVYEPQPADNTDQLPAAEPEPVEPQTAQNGVADSWLSGIGWNDMQIQMKVLLIALGVAILLIIILIILFAVMSHKNKKYRKMSAKRHQAAQAAHRGQSRSGGSGANRRTAPLSKDEIPARSNRHASSAGDGEESFFSYVKTDKDDFDTDDFD